VVTLGTSVDQWADELDAHTNWSYQMYRGPRRKGYLGSLAPDVRLTTYETMRSDVGLLMEAGHDVIIYDEANFLQNCWPAPKGPSQVHVAAERLSSSGRWVWSLTATPVETSLFNMYGIYRAMGRQLYPSVEAFIAEHVEMEYMDVPVVRRVKGKRQFQQRVTIPKVKRHVNIEEFKARIADLYLRRELEELGIEMPEVLSIDVSLDMSPAQRRVYDDITAGILAQGPSVFRTVAGGQKLNYQARCCDGLGSLRESGSDVSVKLDECVRRVRDDLLPEQVVIFSRYIKPLKELEERFAHEGITTGRIDGEVGADACTRAKRGFESGAFKVLLLSEKGERALNLPQARYLILVQQLWNPQKLIQLIGRLRRMTSQWKGIIVFNLLCRDTFEEGMVKVVRERSELFCDVFDTEDLLKALPEDEAFALVTATGRRRAA
jgi:SNF2 family DNA or RNA helicase